MLIYTETSTLEENFMEQRKHKRKLEQSTENNPPETKKKVKDSPQEPSNTETIGNLLENLKAKQQELQKSIDSGDVGFEQWQFWYHLKNLLDKWRDKIAEILYEKCGITQDQLDVFADLNQRDDFCLKGIGNYIYRTGDKATEYYCKEALLQVSNPPNPGENSDDSSVYTDSESDEYLQQYADTKPTDPIIIPPFPPKSPDTEFDIQIPEKGESSPPAREDDSKLSSSTFSHITRELNSPSPPPPIDTEFGQPSLVELDIPVFHLPEKSVAGIEVKKNKTLKEFASTPSLSDLDHTFFRKEEEKKSLHNDPLVINTSTDTDTNKVEPPTPTTT
jgi:hypothetical protein